MAPKRALGIGKSAKAKKQQVSSVSATPELDNSITPQGKSSSESPAPAEAELQQQLTVELDETVDPDDEISQLRALWKTYANSDRDNELMLNGIIHECDRLLRNHHDDTKLQITPEFHAVYALALAELAKFHTIVMEEDQDEEVVQTADHEKVADYFDAALDRAGLGIEAFPQSGLLQYVLNTVKLNRIPLEYISQMDLNSTKKDFPVNLKKSLDEIRAAIDGVARVDGFESEIVEFYEAFDDLIEIVSNFGQETLEGLDSEDEEELQEVKLSKKHPLFEIHGDLKNLQGWLRKSLETRYSNIEDQKVKSKIASKLGRGYLADAEYFTQIYTTLKYDDEETDETEIDGFDIEKSRSKALENCKQAIDYLKKAYDESKPETVVELAEAEINLGNLYDVDSEEQEQYYKSAEVKLRKANNVTHGKYQDILDNLLQGSDD